MSAREMTLANIADVANVHIRTAQRWAEIASDKMSSVGDKMSSSSPTHPAAFTLPETLAIIRAGGKATLAALLEENARKATATTPKLPNGTQLRELNRMAERKILSPYQVQLVLGVAVPRENPLPEVPATEAEAREGFARVRAVFDGRKALPAPFAAKSMAAAAAAYDSTAKRLAEHAAADAKQGRLM